MKIIERMKNIFAKPEQLPDGFVRNAEYDVVLLYDLFGRMPEIVRAKNGKKYFYFDDMDDEKLAILRKMGFNPRLHKSHMYHPAKYIYRAPIMFDLTNEALAVAGKIKAQKYYSVTSSFPLMWNNIKQDPAYQKYVAVYKSHQKTK